MKVTLDSNPSDAPCCLKLISEDGRDILIQTDWDYPGLASELGWSTASVRVNSTICEHEGTDGTIDCDPCGATAGDFIASAAEYLQEHDGEEFEDPGYFNE